MATDKLSWLVRTAGPTSLFGSKWSGTTPSGVRVEGYLQPKTTVYQFISDKMNIIFSWKRDADGYAPVSRSNLLNQDGVNLLDCVLMDSGGLHYLETIPWLNEGTNRIASVATRELESSDWSRETWGVEFRNNKAKIYSLHDEEYVQILSLDGFSKVLQEWTAFLQSKPDDRETGTLNLSIEG